MASPITVIAVGRLGRGPEAELCASYAKRIAWPMDIIEIDDRKAPAAKRKVWEAAQILNACPRDAHIILLDERGRAVTSPQLARLIGAKREAGEALAFIIGGADGVDEAVRVRAGEAIAFGGMTWPHKLARAMLMEQLYRAGTILTGHPYHRS
ncbi:MAG: 23S rRNA (pseudouridine(1915)-N(3))-methyltransferase RlmH [Pseudomonadota bacterium]